VIVDGEVNQAFGMEDVNATYENAALLTKAGVLVAFKPTFSRIVILDRSPRWTAGRAARYGLRLHDALAAITINPAKMFGLADRYGSIETGKDADLVIWSGDPLETTTVARMVMIEGVEQPLTARNRELRDRYLPTVAAAR
jgi:imidazolonepropionase-like amidohydrolase